MVSDAIIPILVMEDAKGKACLSIEPFRQEDGDLRLFKEVSGSSFSSNYDVIDRFKRFLQSVGAERVVFEDTRKATLYKLLRKTGYRRAKTYESRRGAFADWPSWGSEVPEGATTFGTSEGLQPPSGQKFRRMRLSDKDGKVGEIFFTDFGRFARAKANEFGTEGFGFTYDGRPPSALLLELAVQLLEQGKRYLILGPEYAEFVSPVHPFPLWQMGTSSMHEYDHGCRPAVGSELNALAKLVSEYEDIPRSAALSNVTRCFYNPSFRFILPPDNNGFSLIRFMEGAQGMINDLYVRPSSQGKGIGEDLTRASLDMLSESCIGIRLNTIYPRARKLYEKYGFKVVYQDYCVALRQRIMSAPR